MTARQAERVRFGGYRGPDGYVFELTGGAFCLDLANTLGLRRTATPHERLESYGDLVGWGTQAGAVSGPVASSLRREAARDPRAASRALARARAAREELFAVFSAVADGRVPPAGALDALAPRLAEAFARRRLVRAKGEIAWAFPEDDPVPFDRILWSALVSAADLLTAPAERARVRRCEEDRCAWLFLDRSRNGSRRWCDMTVCGNRVKARRHYARVKRAG